MALVVNDRVKETSTTTGTGTFTLDGAVTGFETFSSAIGNSNTTYYAIEIPNSTEFEVGLGTVSAGQLARTTVISSSNSDALVNFSAGTKNVFCTLPASKAVIKDASDNVTLPADLTVDTDTLYVDSTNNRVGIGTTSPTRKLTIAGGNDAKIQFKGGDVQSLYFGDSGTDFAGYLHYDHNNDQFRINTLSSTVLTGGSVGIGTTSPSAQLHITGSDTSDQVIFENTDAGTGTAPDLVFYRNSASPAVNDLLGRIDFRGKNDGGTSIDYGFIYGVIEDETAGTEDGALWFNLEKNGSVIQPLKLKSNENVFNDNGEDINFRIESNNDANIFFVDAGNDRIGIGTSSPGTALHMRIDGGDANLLLERSTAGVTSKWGIKPYNDKLHFRDESASPIIDNFTMTSDGYFGIGTTSPSSLLHLSSADPQITITDTDGTGSPVIKADVNDLVLDSPGNIILDAFSNSLIFKDNGQQIGTFANFSGDFGMQSSIVDQDIIFRGNDNGVVSTVLTLDMSEAGAATFNDKIILGANKVIEFGDAGETISGDGTDLTIASSRHIKFDATNDITLDSGAGGLKFDDDGVTIGLLFNASGDLTFKVVQQDKDLNIKGNDGGSEITALSLDMSEAGAATFNSSVTVGANLDVSSGTIKLDGNYPTGTNNVALGNTALDSIGTGGAGHNVAIGHAALTADNTGTGNVGIGAFALTSTVTGNYSTAIGQEALKVNTASWNNAIGFQSMLTSVGGEKNIAMGFWSLKNLGSNDKNVAIGHEAGINLTGGDNNIIIGHNAQAASATTSNQITLGDANITSLRIPGLQSGASSGDILTYDGTDIGLSTPTFISNVVEDTTPQLGGDLDLNSNNITGTGNINNVGTITTDGLTVDGNVSVDSGTIKLDGNYPTGANNVAMGDTALDSVTTGASNTMIGHQAGTDLLGGGNNTGIGNRALANITSASSNTAVGSDALLFATTGGGNTALGKSTMQTERTGGSNVAVGQGALITQNGGNLNTAIGYDSGNTITTGSNLTLLGYAAQASSATATNEITLGNSNVTSLRIPGLASGASSGDVLTYDGTDITLSAPTGVTAGFVIAMSIAL